MSLSIVRVRLEEGHNNNRLGDSMKNLLLVLLVGWLMVAQTVNAQLVSPGENFELSFYDLPSVDLLPDTHDQLVVTFNFVNQYSLDLEGNVTAIHNGLFNMDLFENVDSAMPFSSSRDESVSVGSAYMWLGGVIPWTDRDGKLVIWATGGDFDLTSIDISVISEGIRYQQFFDLTAVPLPASAWLLASGMLAMFSGTYSRKSR